MQPRNSYAAKPGWESFDASQVKQQTKASKRCANWSTEVGDIEME
jgi:hypothetical protein